MSQQNTESTLLKTESTLLKTEPKSWSSLIDRYVTMLRDSTTTERQVAAIRENLAKLARLVDRCTESVKQQDSELFDAIVKVTKPKFCGDTSIILDAKVKVTGFKGDDTHLNGLIGKATHPFSRGYNTTGMIGIKLYPNQKIPLIVTDNCLNVDSDKVMFIE